MMPGLIGGKIAPMSGLSLVAGDESQKLIGQNQKIDGYNVPEKVVVHGVITMNQAMTLSSCRDILHLCFP